MHSSVHQFVAEEALRTHTTDKSVLDVGSLNINGTVRDCFTGPYLGVDLQPGAGVDQVLRARDLPTQLTPASFDVVLCLEMLEHDVCFWESLPAMGAMLAPGGLLLLTTRGFDFPLHEHPCDYWRFGLDSAAALAALAGVVPLRIQPDPQLPGLFLSAVKEAA